jgi:hypothetical protein
MYEANSLYKEFDNSNRFPLVSGRRLLSIMEGWTGNTTQLNWFSYQPFL